MILEIRWTGWRTLAAVPLLALLAATPSLPQTLVPEDPSVEALKKLHPILVEYASTMGALPVDLMELERFGFVEDARVLFPPRSLAARLHHTDQEGLTPWRVTNRSMEGYVLVSDEARERRVYALRADGRVDVFQASWHAWYGSWKSDFDIPNAASDEESGIEIPELGFTVFEIPTGKARPAIVIHGNSRDDAVGDHLASGARLLSVGGHQVTTVAELQRFLLTPAGRRLARAPIEVMLEGEIVQVGLQPKASTLPRAPKALLPEALTPGSSAPESTASSGGGSAEEGEDRADPDGAAPDRRHRGTRPSPELVEAAKAGDLYRVLRELDTGADVGSIDERGQNALMHASYRGHRRIVEELIRAGADVNVAGSRGETPLLAAVDGGHPEILKVLVAAGADKEHRDDGGATLLAAAANRGDVATIRAVLDLGVDVNADSFYRRGIRVHATALMIAASRRREEAVSFLLGQGAFVDTVGDLGMTALMAAAEAKADDIVALLLAAGADPHLTDERGRTALGIARDRQSERAVRLLENALGQP